jgi:hypothetical protein
MNMKVISGIGSNLAKMSRKSKAHEVCMKECLEMNKERWTWLLGKVL